MKKKIAGLLVLSAVPMFAGISRLLSLSTGRFTMDGHERFSADPWTAALHMIGATAFATVGAFQFVPSLRRGAWHRITGRVLSVLGIGATIAGTAMALRWTPKAFDSAALNAVRMVVAIASVAFIVLGVVAARRRDFEAHGAWMLRAYALFLGAGTQVFTAGFTALPFMQPHMSEGLAAASMAAGWIINALVAEWMLRKPRVADMKKGPWQRA
ncbi:MAG: DUF2306 domain-containing protein [Myxococcales bacterium]|nr:DUF2306 domain-containing protein [Myxococcales bacterium]